MRITVVSALAAVVLFLPPAASPEAPLAESVRTLNGSANNLRHPDWGRANTPYVRVGRANYADGVQKMVAGPPARYVSNRIFNDLGQNIFSENDVSQWGFTWGQFLDHDFGLRDETPAEHEPIAFDRHDPLEQFRNDLAAIEFSRTPAAKGTGVTTPREQINTISSFIDGSGVYGLTSARLDWLRRGPRDGDPSNNAARLLSTRAGYLPRAAARGKRATAPKMGLFGRLVATPAKAMVAGDVRANENIALTAVHTLFLREHNRIVAALPSSLSEEEKFQIARRVVGAEIQWITYNEFLPALGVRLSRYRGYDPRVDPSLANEFAVVGYRAHSMIHGTIEPVARVGTYSRAQLNRFRKAGIEVTTEDGRVRLEIPLNLAFGNPDLFRAVGLGPVLAGLGAERQYRNDEQIDNQLRSVLFQVPRPGVDDPAECLEGDDLAKCFRGVLDLAAIDIERGRDHGMPSYNDLRRAYGLAPKTSFTGITGESTEAFPRDPRIDAADPIDDPNILDFIELRDRDGNLVRPGSDAAKEDVVSAVRRTTLAARLKAIYGSVDRLDAFVGMVSEAHVPGTEFGELQLAIWRRQFEALRDGDRFYYQNDSLLRTIERQYRITYRHSLAQLIELNTGADVERGVFKAEPESESDAAAIPAAAPRQMPHADRSGGCPHDPAREWAELRRTA
jgi:Animal haem peroxidase